MQNTILYQMSVLSADLDFVFAYEGCYPKFLGNRIAELG